MLLKYYLIPFLFLFEFLADFDKSAVDTLVIEDSPFLSDPLPPCKYTPSLWLKADAGTTLAGTSVITWNDQSGNANNSTQGTTNRRPIYRDNSINFNPSLDFDGSNDFLQGNAGGANTMLFMVAKSDNLISRSSGGQTIITTDAQNPVSNVYFFTLGSITGAFPNEVITNGFGNSSEYRRVQTGNATYLTTPHLYTTNHIQSSTSSTIHVNGARVDNNTANAFINPENNRAYRIGGNLYIFGGFYFNGQIAEVLSFPNNLDAANQEIIQSYLGIKYGISLAHAYRNSSNAILWNEAAYPNNIGAIGRDDCFGLHQKQTKNTDTGAILTIGLGTIEADNATNPNSFSVDQSFLFWGNNNDDNGVIEEITTELPTGIQRRLDREWKIRNINNVGSTELQFDLTGIPNSATSSMDLFLIIDEDGDGDFTTGTIQQIPASSYTNNIVSFENITLTDEVVISIATLPKPNSAPQIKALTDRIEVCPNGLDTLITPSIRVEDLDGDNLVAQITITGITDNADDISVDLTGFPTASQTFIYPVLQINGTISSPEMQSILGSLSFSTTSMLSGLRNIDIVVNDGMEDSNTIQQEVYADENLAMCCSANAPLISK